MLSKLQKNTYEMLGFSKSKVLSNFMRKEVWNKDFSDRKFLDVVKKDN